jgi:hypothetical protein
MPKRSSSPPSPPADETPAAPGTAPEKNPAAVALGRMGGLKGGKARAASLSKKKRSEIAKKAATARWRQVGSGGDGKGK